MGNSALINVMTGAVIKAGKGLLRDYGEVDQLQISRKGTANFVTATDIRTEKLLHKELSIARPDFGFLMEEGGEIAGKDSNHRWIIDPLDGTTNFIHAIPYFCISVALERRIGDRRDIIAGVIYDPIHNDLFFAEKGTGAFLNNRKLGASNRETLEDSMLVTGNPRFSTDAEHDGFGVLKKVTDAGATLRYYGAAALDLAYMAAGRIDACWFYTIKPWDIAAGLLLVQEAGGIVTEIDGKKATAHSPNLLAANRHLHQPIQKLLSKGS